ncbi:p21-activated protein kinase-interacting protein 1 [Yarrowia sp. B02]|nr:p21-activated protein kinase-interacting protein 1 [Yarrowia sp. B02]
MSKITKPKSALKGSKSDKKQVRVAAEAAEKIVAEKTPDTATDLPKTTVGTSTVDPAFRIVTGSYEHNLFCVSLLLGTSPVFSPIFHFTPHIQSIKCLATSGRYLVSGSADENIRIYDLQKRKELGTLTHHSGTITALEFYKRKWLLTAGEDGKIFVLRTKDWEVLAELKGHARAAVGKAKVGVVDISVHPTGRLALSVGQDRKLILWNLMTAKKASVMQCYPDVLKVAWNLAGDRYAVTYTTSISFFSPESGKLVGTIRSPRDGLYHSEYVSIAGKEYFAFSNSRGVIRFVDTSEFEGQINDAKNEFKTEDEDIDDVSFKVQPHATRVKDFSFIRPDNVPEADRHVYMTSVSTDSKLVVTDMNTRETVGAYNTGDRLNCCVMVQEDVELEIKKALPMPESDHDMSASESEAEMPKPSKKQQKRARQAAAKHKKVEVKIEKDN